MHYPSRSTVIEAVPLTAEAFAPFGDVTENPRPDVHPSSADKHLPLPLAAIVANQGSAIKYQHVSRQINLYDQAPSGRPGSAVMNVFVCAARAHIPDPPQTPAPASAPTQNPAVAEQQQPASPHPQPSTFPITVLERHPYTTQTFIPLTADPAAHYLVIVAPSLPPGKKKKDDDDLNNGPPQDTLPVPTRLPPATEYPRPLPGRGMPDLRRVRAFVASAAQAVTYGAGTWHAPMVALGEKGTAVDFVVVQFANGVGVEDCQEVGLRGEGALDKGGLLVVLKSGERSGGGGRGEGRAKL
ncbi:ureidoglycolate hydrolase [Chaetomium fimeti]|uniref:Ureidoglycolate hydrolase n=1 Tax=Chaetomium fimeti TaxID=1854472 RepID=A0AAE0HE99_9PEZI|nr:ureidoglycolate hydrolase [Chaetomium fimeti]